MRESAASSHRRLEKEAKCNSVQQEEMAEKGYLLTYLCVFRLPMDSTIVLEGLFKNTTPHQQHWVSSVWVLPSNHLLVIGGQQQHPNVTNV